MADGSAPAMDKVGAPLPGAGAPQIVPPGLSAAAPTSAPGAPASANSSGIPGLGAPATSAPQAEGKKPEEKKLEAVAGGAGPGLGAPKPVEVMSVPETPVNGSTPAGGTPRPELDIPRDHIEVPEASEAVDDKPAATAGAKEPTPTPAVAPLPTEESTSDPVKDGPSGGLNGNASEPAEMTGAIPTASNEKDDDGASPAPATLKRKLEDEDEAPASAPGAAGPINGDAAQAKPERAEKKAKLDSAVAEPAAPATGAETETGANGEKTNGKQKRGLGKRAKKIAEAVVGRTARKTRSQGPAQ